jgi:hypothetical protein
MESPILQVDLSSELVLKIFKDFIQPGIRVRPVQGLHGIDFLSENPLAKVSLSLSLL